ncbi:MAG: protein kinase domain-containing protein [Kofleriaceae bacterium]
MRYRCPACQRSFDEPGYCPFDRTQLTTAAGPEARTVVSAPMAAANPPRTALEPRRGTFPLTPSTPPAPAAPAVPAAPVLPAGTAEVTQARNRPAQPTPHTPSELRAVSASENPQQALEAYQTGRDNAYDRLIGQTLDGRYYVEKKIGEGGMGVVFSARHAVIERPLAIKVLKREVMRDTATIRRFVQEAKAASRIGHPNIVDVTDFGTTPDGMTYSVMEFVQGQTLGSALRRGAPFAFPRALRIAAQIARALGAAHDKGIVHRDLKPENVFLVDRDGRPDFVKIVDFGIAKVTPVTGAQNPNEPRLTRAGSEFGTPEYMAPEQAAGRSDTDGRVDIYALGVILYEMLTGRVPHRGDSMVRTLAMQMLDPVQPPSQVRPDLAISPELEAVVLKALAKKRDQRYQTMGELLAALDQLQTPIAHSLTGSPVYALSPVPPGADPNLADRSAPIAVPTTPAPHVAPTTSPSTQERTRTPSTGPTGSTTRRLKDEPEFVTRDKPMTFEHVFTDEHALPRNRRWPVLLLIALVLGGGAVAIALVMKSRDRGAPDRREIVTPAVPADAVQVAEADAQLVAPTTPNDAAVIVERPTDAGPRIAVHTRDPDPVDLLPPPRGRPLGIVVMTQPEGATLYAGTTYRGRGGTNVVEPMGTRLELECRHPGYKPGRVQLVFDGEREVELCVMTRIKICIPGVKNPFDDCEPEAGSAAAPAGATP